MKPYPTFQQTDALIRHRRDLAQAREPISHPTVAYAGTLGSYAEEAAMTFFKDDAHFLPHHSFEDVFKSITGGGAHYGVLPIENSSTGSISAVYDLLSQYRCFMVGEEKITIEHCLLGLPGTSLDAITEVYSHPQGFSQSQAFLSHHPQWKCIPWHNTAVAAKMVAEEKNPHYAAIASGRAAKIHGLSILAPTINSLDHNSTRFVVVSPVMEKRPDQDKISLAFHLPHESGALYRILGIFEAHHLNLCKIESRPLAHANWEYRFFLDFLDARDSQVVEAVIEAVIHQSATFTFLGHYPSKK